VPNFRCQEPGNLPHFCDADIDRMLDEALGLQQVDTAAAGRAWAGIDRAVVDAAPWAPLLNIRELDFVSERVGNYQRHVHWGLLLDQVWVQ
jgi:peptide/nickel transport system substrate-binding protein